MQDQQILGERDFKELKSFWKGERKSIRFDFGKITQVPVKRTDALRWQGDQLGLTEGYRSGSSEILWLPELRLS